MRPSAATEKHISELEDTPREGKLLPFEHDRAIRHVHAQRDKERRPSELADNRVSVIIPTLNEALNLPHILPRIPDWVDEVLIVDGHSTDVTIEVAQALLPSARIILQEGRGKGNALACGFTAARGEIIVMLDADGSTDPAEITMFVEALLAGADFAKGSRCMVGGGSADLSVLRSTGNRVLTKIVNALYGRRYTDLCYGYNAFWSHCLHHMQVDCDGFEVETLIHVRVARASLEVCEVPSMEHRRLFGKSNLNALSDGWRVLRTIIGERLAPKAELAAGTWIGPGFDECSPAGDDAHARRVLAQ